MKAINTFNEEVETVSAQVEQNKRYYGIKVIGEIFFTAFQHATPRKLGDVVELCY